VVSEYFGESEAGLRGIFAAAAALQPSVRLLLLLLLLPGLTESACKLGGCWVLLLGGTCCEAGRMLVVATCSTNCKAGS